MNKPLIQQFADYAATRNGPFETDDCEHCPMADFAHSLYPNAEYCSAGEEFVSIYLPNGEAANIGFDIVDFFSRFIEHCPSWEVLTQRLRRAVA